LVGEKEKREERNRCVERERSINDFESNYKIWSFE
jgi:hypothetical protein